jgi:hypothetical protein
MNHSNHSNESWIPHTDGKNVWAVNSKTGLTARFLHDRSSPVVSVHSLGEEIGIVTQDGRTRTWNPKTGSSRTFL